MRPSRPPRRHPPLHRRIGRKVPSLFACTSPAMERLLPFLVSPLQGGAACRRPFPPLSSLYKGRRLAEGESEGSFCRRTFLFCNRGVCAFWGNDPPIPGIRPPRRLFAEQKSGAYFHKRRPKNLCYSSFFSSALPSSASFTARAFAILASCLACFFISLVTTRAASICACISCGVGGTNDAPSAFSGMTS